MKIFYIHHALRDMGDPPTNDDGLTPLGLEDANTASKILDSMVFKSRIKAIYTSPYFRCRQTARILASRLNVPIIDEPRFNEFNNVFSAVKGQKSIKGETWTECQTRVQDAIKDIVYKYNDNDIVLCVTSGVNISAFINLSFHLTPSENTPFPLVPSCSPIGFDITREHFEVKQ